MTDALMLALIVGAVTYAFRFGPTQIHQGDLSKDGALARFLAATGPAAIATLFVASILPTLRGGALMPEVIGVAGVIGLFIWRRSVVVATLGGALFYGAAFGLLAIP
jgi:branched-subunit amino acid transport protein AzlD